MDRRVLAAGTELGGYVLGPVLGSGGMGTVYRAVDADGMTVALKLLHPALATDPDARRRLRREVDVLQRLRGPGVARVVDAELEAPDAFVVTEYIHGQTLSQTVAADGPYEAAELADLAESLAVTLAEVHAAGVIHRDLKPGNIMVGPDGPVLIDFGIAQEGEATRLTGTGLVVGTPGFVAPELIAGGEPTEASDEWGLAAALTFAATGRVPFGEGRFDVVFGRVAAGQVDVAGLHGAVGEPLLAALRPDPTDRLRASSLAAALRHAASPSEGGWTAATRRYGASAAATSAHRHPDADFPDDAVHPDFRTDFRTDLVGPGGAEEADVTRRLPDPGAEGFGWEPGDRAGLPGESREMGFRGGASGSASPWVDGGPESPWAVRPAVPRRRVLAVALWLGLSALATLAPVVGGGIVGGILLLGRAFGVGSEGLRRRRARRGARRGDGLRAAAAAPAYLVRAAIGLVPALVVGVAFGALVWVMLRYGVRGGLAEDLALGLGIAVATAVVWAGPAGEETRRGTLHLLGAAARPWWVRALVGVAAVAWAGLVAAGWLTGASEGPLSWVF